MDERHEGEGVTEERFEDTNRALLAVRRDLLGLALPGEVVTFSFVVNEDGSVAVRRHRAPFENVMRGVKA